MGGIIDNARHQIGIKRDSVELSSISAPPGTLDLSAARATWQSLSTQDIEDLPDILNDDVLLEVIGKLDGSNRQALGATCRHMRRVTHGTLRRVTIRVHPGAASQSAVNRGMQTDVHVSDDTGLLNSLIQGNSHLGLRMAEMSSITLQLPSSSYDSKQRTAGYCAAGNLTDNSPDTSWATVALNAFLSETLSGSSIHPSLPGLHELYIKPLGKEKNTCHVSYEALAILAVSAPNLSTLHLPLLSPNAANALALLPRTLSSLTVTVSDSPSIDLIVQIPGLKHLSISTREGLLYVVLSLSQISDLAKISGLQSLSLHRVLLNDCRVTWEPFSCMAALTELRVSSPLSADRLVPLSHLSVLHLPSFTSGTLESISSLGHASRLRELWCRQALSEADLYALSHLPKLELLQCDDIALSDAKSSAAYSALYSGHPSTVPLPCLPMIRVLRIVGHHHRHGSLLGLLFPGLERLASTSMEPPAGLSRQAQIITANLPYLRSLAMPSCKALPSIITAAPGLRSLSVSAINCQQRLEELIQLSLSFKASKPGCVDPELLKQQDHGVSSDRNGGFCWWPQDLSDLSLGFSSSLRFRPKQIALALSSAPICLTSRITSLSLRDHGRDAADPAGRVVDDLVVNAAARVLTKLERLSLIDCGALTASGLKDALASASPKLSSVTVAGCTRVSRGAAEGIPAALGGKHWMDVRWQETVAHADCLMD